MKILAIEKETGAGTVEGFQSLSTAEARRAWELYQQGLIRELYFRQDRTNAVLMLECADLKEASELLATLPLVREGLIEFELVPLVAYPGFERLFAD